MIRRRWRSYVHRSGNRGTAHGEPHRPGQEDTSPIFSLPINIPSNTYHPQDGFESAKSKDNFGPAALAKAPVLFTTGAPLRYLKDSIYSITVLNYYYFHCIFAFVAQCNMLSTQLTSSYQGV